MKESLFKDSSIFYFIVTDLAGNYLFVSDLFKKRFQHLSSNFIGTSTMESIIPEDHGKCIECVQTCMNNPHMAFSVELRKPSLEGNYFWTNWEFTFTEYEGVMSIVCVGYDVSNTKKALEELIKKDLLFQNLAAHVPGMFFQFKQTPDGVFSFPMVSEGVVENLELTSEELLNDSNAMFIRVHPQDRAQFEESIAQSAQLMENWDLEFRVLLPQKGLRWIHGRSKPEKLADGSILWNGFIWDVTEKKLSVKELEQKERMLYAIATASDHLLEFNEVFTSINTTLSLLGHAAGVDRTYLFKNEIDVQHNAYSCQLLEWNSGQADAQIDNPELQRLYFSSVPDFFEPLAQRKPFIAIVSLMPDSSPTKQVLQDQEIQSILVLPVFVRDKFWGFVGLDDCSTERVWNESELALLRTFVASIAKAIQRNDVEHELRHSEQKFRDLFEMAPVGMVLLHPKTLVFQEVNFAFANMMRQTLTDLNGKSWVAFWSATNEDFHEFKLQATSGGRFGPFERVLIRHDGTEMQALLSGINMQDPSGSPIIWCLVQDISSQKDAEREREQLINELSLSNAELKQFSYITTHNLRAPITNLIGLLELMQYHEVSDENLREVLDGFQVSTQKINQTINDLIQILIIKDSPGIEQKWLALESVFTDIRKVLEHIEKEAAPQWDIDFSEAPHVFFNLRYLESIFLNLLSNAYKFKAPNRPLHIQIRSFNTADSTVLTFADNGLGLDIEKYKSKIFGLYQRFHANFDSKGLGLYLVKAQLEALGGHISVKGAPNEGLQFVLTFKKHT